jgi:hypothetical protein
MDVIDSEPVPIGNDLLFIGTPVAVQKAYLNILAIARNN